MLLLGLQVALDLVTHLLQLLLLLALQVAVHLHPAVGSNPLSPQNLVALRIPGADGLALLLKAIAGPRLQARVSLGRALVRAVQ